MPLSTIEKLNALKQAFVPAQPPQAAGAVPPQGPPPGDPAVAGGQPPMDASAIPPEILAQLGLQPDGQGGIVDQNGQPVDPAEVMAFLQQQGMDPSAQAGAPPVDSGTGTPPPPQDPTAQMAQEQQMQQMIGQAVQQALAQAGIQPGQQQGSGQGKGNKVEAAIAALKDDFAKQLEQQQRVIIAALKAKGIDVSMADVMGLPDMSTGQTAGGDVAPELSVPGMSAKASSIDATVNKMVELARLRDVAKSASAMSQKLSYRDPMAIDKSYFANLYR